MALDNDTIYEALETIQTASGVIEEGDRILGSNMPADMPEASLIADGATPWAVQAAKDALAASRL